jgi:hypothetical protein
MAVFIYSVLIRVVSHSCSEHELGKGKLVQITRHDAVTAYWYVGQTARSEMWVSPLRNMGFGLCRTFYFPRWYISRDRRIVQNRHCSVFMRTDYRFEDQGSILGEGKRFFSIPECPQRLWGPPSLTSNGVIGLKWHRRWADHSRWRYCIFFRLLNPSSRTMALNLTQPLTEMSTRNLHGR